MRLKERQTGRQQLGILQPRSNPIRRQTGEIKEPQRAPFVGKSRRKRRQRQHVIVGWSRGRHRVVWNRKGEEVAKILVVEDNALNIKLFCDLLAAHGHEPEAVTDSREALDTARAFKPDLVITDIQLPHVSGLELMELIRNDEDLATVPIMAVTAYSGVGDDERIKAAGAQAYVSKPISVMRFAETVDELLEQGPIEREPNEKGGSEPDAALDEGA